jgi:hypothetical protein
MILVGRARVKQSFSMTLMVLYLKYDVSTNEIIDIKKNYYSE